MELVKIFTSILFLATIEHNVSGDEVSPQLKNGASDLKNEMQSLLVNNLGYNKLQVSNFFLFENSIVPFSRYEQPGCNPKLDSRKSAEKSFFFG